MNGLFRVDPLLKQTNPPRFRIKAGQRLFLAIFFLTSIIVASGSFGLWLSAAIHSSAENLQSTTLNEVPLSDPAVLQTVASTQADQLSRVGSLMRLVSMIAIGLGIAFSLVAYGIIRKAVYSRLTHLIGIVEGIPAGSFIASQNPFGVAPLQDEIGQLSQALARMYDWMQSSFARLEAEVQEQSASLQRRSDQLDVAAQFASEIAASHDLETLLYQAVNIIRDHFGFYHAGIFLNDLADEFTVLRAATGEAGRLMLARAHRLKIGEIGVVGRVAQSGKPRIASDVGQDAAHYKNPLLPETRSEAALPLKSAGNVIGVLDVQSRQPAAFNMESLSIFQIMADQLAIAIQNTRLYQESQENYARLELTYREINHHAWNRMVQSAHLTGYEFDGLKSQPIYKAVMTPDKSDPDNEGASLQIPLHLRGEQIGELDIWKGEGELSETDVEFIKILSDRLSQSLESARLYEAAQRQAWREQQINRITSEARMSIHLETILQNTVRELGKSLGASRAFIQIGGDSFWHESSASEPSASTQLEPMKSIESSPSTGLNPVLAKKTAIQTRQADHEPHHNASL